MTGRTMEEGAAAHIDAAIVKGTESHGHFLIDCDIEPLVTVPVL